MSYHRYLAVIVAAAALLPVVHSARAVTVTLNASNAAGQSSFASSLSWSNGQAPSAANDYVVASAFSLRKVADSTGTVTFAGNSLTLGNGTQAGILVFKNLNGAVVNVNNLTLNNGEVRAGGTAGSAVNQTTLGGSVTLVATASRFNSGTTGRSMIVSASIGGGGNVSFTSGGWTQFLDQSGTGLLKFTSALQTTSGDVQKTLVLQGSTAGTGEFAGAIADRTSAFKTSVVKNGSGQWSISGTNPYTGTTTVNGGTLLVNGTNSGTGAVTVAGGTLGGTGSRFRSVGVSAST